MICYLDVETCGFHGPIVLLQYAFDEDPVTMYEVWSEPVPKTLALMEEIAACTVIGYNLAFDWFHMCQMYTTLQEYQARYPKANGVLVEHLYADCEEAARDRGCLKPLSAFDLMLHARKHEYQYLMDRKDITIRRIPAEIAPALCNLLNAELPFRPIFFERYKSLVPRKAWQVFDSQDHRFKSIICKFAPSTRLKSLAKDILEDDEVQEFDAIAVDPNFHPLELGYAPFAKAVQRLPEWKGKNKRRFYGEWKGAWPTVIEQHQNHWAYNADARKYAANDVNFLRRIYKFFGSPPTGDTDSILTCMVGAIRWRGFRVDIEYLKELKAKAQDIKGKIPVAPSNVMRYFQKDIDPMEKLMLPEKTDKEVLTNLIRMDENAWSQIEAIDKQKISASERWDLLQAINWEFELSRKALNVLEARKAEKEVQTCDKLLLAGRFHASLKVLGTLSSRMSGADGFNAQGVKRAKYFRKAFPIAWEEQILSGGDFAGFEVTIADAIYDDPRLRTDLTSTIECVYCDGAGCKECGSTGRERKKIHAIFGTHIFPGYTYKDIRLTSGKVPDLYTTAKSGLFTWLFAGTEYSFEKRLGVPKEQAKNGLLSFEATYPEVGKKRRAAMVDFCPVYQEGEKILWRAHKSNVSTLLGFTRFFDVEFSVVRKLYDLPGLLPQEWKDVPSRVIRKDRVQTLYGATTSALFGASFALQNYLARVAINMPIQGTGAQITKELQADIWKLQPSGYHNWVVMPLNIHDEVMVPVDPSRVDDLNEVVKTSVEKWRSVVPLLEMEWHQQMGSWADK